MTSLVGLCNMEEGVKLRVEGRICHLSCCVVVCVCVWEVPTNQPTNQPQALLCISSEPNITCYFIPFSFGVFHLSFFLLPIKQQSPNLRVPPKLFPTQRSPMPFIATCHSSIAPSRASLMS